MEVMERMNRMEQAHNNLAKAFEKTERELNIALQSVRHLQQTHMLTLSNQAKMEAELKQIK
jgi:GTP cyclohydrolase II